MLAILKKLYKGEYSLGKSYWFFGNIVPFFLFLIIILGIFIPANDPLAKLRNIDFTPETTASLSITIIMSLLTLVYIIISTIGVWRSASKHEGKKHWAILAKITIIIAFLSYINDIRKFLF